MHNNIPAVVTGGNGYIASHLILQLLQRGQRVRATVRDVNDPKKTDPLRSLCPEAKTNLEIVEGDLMEAECWERAMEGGVEEVYHVASPVPINEPENEDDIIIPAVNGTLNVLKGCHGSGTVRRVVMTSSLAAVWNKKTGKRRRLTEEDWSDLSKVSHYMKSKHLSEKAAWEYLERIPEDQKFELVTLHPGVVMGPLLFPCATASGEVPRRLLNREVPAIPKVKMQIIDVRDVAAAHISAMVTKEAEGNRHVLVNHPEGTWFSEAAKIVKKEFKKMGYSITTREAPNILVKIAAKFDPSLRIVVPVLEEEIEVDNKRMRKVLGIQPIPLEKTVVDMCHSLIELGIVKKTSKYKPQKKTHRKNKRKNKSDDQKTNNKENGMKADDNIDQEMQTGDKMIQRKVNQVKADDRIEQEIKADDLNIGVKADNVKVQDINHIVTQL